MTYLRKSPASAYRKRRDDRLAKIRKGEPDPVPPEEALSEADEPVFADDVETEVQEPIELESEDVPERVTSFLDELKAYKVIDENGLEIITYDSPAVWRNSNTPKYDFDTVATAALMAKGIKAEMARILKVNYPVILNYFKKFPELKEILEMGRELALDHAEAKLQEHIDLGNFNALKFYLERQGKDRGWSLRKEELSLKVDYTKLTDSQLKRLADGESPDSVLLDEG